MCVQQMSRASKNEGENWISRKSHFLDWCDFIMRMDDKLQEEISFWETKMILINPSDEEHRKRLLILQYLSLINDLQTLAKNEYFVMEKQDKTFMIWYSNCKMLILDYLVKVLMIWILKNSYLFSMKMNVFTNTSTLSRFECQHGFD